LGDLTSRYREYFHPAGIRSKVQRLAAPDLVPEQTVTADQIERAADILINYSQNKSGGGNGAEPGSVNWIVAWEELKSVLSPAQIEWLGLFVEEEAASVRAGQLQAKLTTQFTSKSVSTTK
jgi:predicted transcriptional regulator